MGSDKSRVTIITTVLLFFIFCSPGCSVLRPHAPSGLQFSSVKLVDVDSLSEEVRADFSRDLIEKVPNKVLEVLFVTQEDLAEARRSWYETSSSGVACADLHENSKGHDVESAGAAAVLNRTRSPRYLTVGGVYQGQVNILKSKAIDKIALEEDFPKRKLIYSFYVQPKKSFPDESRSYDLRIQPLDLCFQIWSAGFIFPGAKTNVIRIPKEVIGAALR